MDTASFHVGNIYLLHFIIPPQRAKRESVMTYLGDNLWSARPIAGTQEMRPEWITNAIDLGKAKGRDDSRHYVNRRAR